MSDPLSYSAHEAKVLHDDKISGVSKIPPYIANHIGDNVISPFTDEKLYQKYISYYRMPHQKSPIDISFFVDWDIKDFYGHKLDSECPNKYVGVKPVLQALNLVRRDSSYTEENRDRMFFIDAYLVIAKEVLLFDDRELVKVLHLLLRNDFVMTLAMSHSMMGITCMLVNRGLRIPRNCELSILRVIGEDVLMGDGSIRDTFFQMKYVDIIFILTLRMITMENKN